jgi:hypothetical protein
MHAGSMAASGKEFVTYCTWLLACCVVHTLRAARCTSSPAKCMASSHAIMHRAAHVPRSVQSCNGVHDCTIARRCMFFHDCTPALLHTAAGQPDG